jgi:hypothetical protein
MIGEKLIARETEVLRVLRTIGSERPYALIGGYAVDAYSALPRYSVDLDIVIARPELEQMASILKQNGFGKGEPYVNEIEGVETRIFTKPIGDDNVSVDMLVDGIRCRQTEAVWKVDEVSKTVKVQRVIGVNDSVPAKVASRELLIALKLHSGRDPDLRDVVMLTADADWAAVLSLANRGSKPKVKDQLEHELKTLIEPDFENRLKTYFGSRQNESNLVNTAAARIRDLLNKI